jgi:hypothetical protein
MSCFICKRHVIIRVYDDKGRSFCGFDHREVQAQRDLHEHFRELERREEAARN